MIICHDLGTTGDKATLISNRRGVAAFTATYSTDFGPRGKAEQDPEAWWDALCSATRDLIGEASIRAETIEAVSFSGQVLDRGALLLDGAGEPARLVDHPLALNTRWIDAGHPPWLERVGMERGYAITGHPTPSSRPYSLSKIMWVRDHEPEIFDRARRVVLNAKDFSVAYRMTGVQATDPSDASSTNAFDQGRWLLVRSSPAAALLPRALFPEIHRLHPDRRPGHLRGCSSGHRLEGGGTPVVMGGGDGPTGALGRWDHRRLMSGAYAYLGSSSWVSVAATAPSAGSPDMLSTGRRRVTSPRASTSPPRPCMPVERPWNGWSTPSCPRL